MSESTHISRGNRWSSVGYLHAPTTNVDRVHVETDASLDEHPIIRLSGPDLVPTTFVAQEAAATNARALDRIAELLSGEVSGADAVMEVSRVVAETGREISDGDEHVKRWTYVVAAQGVFLSPDGFAELQARCAAGHVLPAGETDDDGDVFWTSEAGRSLRRARHQDRGRRRRARVRPPLLPLRSDES